jgi:excisionase family DNA binding protein
VSERLPEKLLTAADVARWANVSERTVRRAIARGDLPAGRAGSQLRIAPEDAHSWVFVKQEPGIVVPLPVGAGVTLGGDHSDEGGSP